MNFITHHFVSIRDANNEILDLIKSNYHLDGELDTIIRDNLTDYFRQLKKEISVFIEYPYVDKVYRDSYYNYFSTKYKEYQRDCIRLSFFSETISREDILDKFDIALLQENFLGYCTLRPTFPNIIGRNMIKKSALKFSAFQTCIHKEDVLINGMKLAVEGFPHSSQDQESITCAETTVWALMEYFGHKYAEYKPVLPSTIINKLNEYSDKRMLPSSGLTAEQISFTLKDFGFGTVVYTQTDDKENFLPNLSVYVESGFPVVVILENKDSEFGHAILMIGRQKLETKVLIEALKNASNDQKIIPFFTLIKNFIVQDDNLPPYSIIPLERPGLHYGVRSEFYKYRITAFVVPLYKKMYMEVQKARTFFDAIFNDSKYGIRTTQKHIFRMYMASSRSFKQHVAKQPIDKTLKTMILNVAMPRFIWCGEYINNLDVKGRSVTSLIILDATEAGENCEDSFIFAAHKNNSLFYLKIDRTYELVRIERPFGRFAMYEHNLN